MKKNMSWLLLGVLLGAFLSALLLKFIPGMIREGDGVNRTITEVFSYAGEDPFYGLLFTDQKGESKRFVLSGSWSHADWKTGEMFDLTYSDKPDSYGAYAAVSVVRKNGKEMKRSDEGYYLEGKYLGVEDEGAWETLQGLEPYQIIRIESGGDIVKGIFLDSTQNMIRYAKQHNQYLGEAAPGHYFLPDELREGDWIKTYVNTGKCYQNGEWLSVFTVFLSP